MQCALHFISMFESSWSYVSQSAKFVAFRHFTHTTAHGQGQIANSSKDDMICQNRIDWPSKPFSHSVVYCHSFPPFFMDDLHMHLFMRRRIVTFSWFWKNCEVKVHSSLILSFFIKQSIMLGIVINKYIPTYFLFSLLSWDRSHIWIFLFLNFQKN